MLDLVVNVDCVGAMRSAAMGEEPDPVVVAAMAEAAGASGVAVHLRADRKFVTERDLRLMRELTKSSFTLQILPTDEAVGMALASRPDLVTVIQEGEEHRPAPMDLVPMERTLSEPVQTLRNAEINIGFFVEPDLKQVKAASRLGAARIELRAEALARAVGTREEEKELERLAAAATMAGKLGIPVYAGGGIDYRCAGKLAQIEEIEGFVVGRAIVSRAVYVGIGRAVKEMLEVLRAGRGT